MKRVSQSDIARASGVSISTVSRVLSSAPGISAPVRDRVMSVARGMGYKIPVPGMVPGTGLRRVVLFDGQLTSPTGLSLVYNAIMTGIRNIADAAGIAVNFAVQDEDGNLPRHILTEPGAGFLFLGTDPTPEVLKAMRARKVPVVLVNGVDPDMIVDSVSPANFLGGRLAARHLVERGHRKILQVTHRSRWTLQRRSEGFVSGVREFGPGDAEVRTVELQQLNKEPVYRDAERWLSHLGDGCSAIFCGNDLVGLAVLQVLKGRGYSVPQDVAVIGFDDLPVAEMADPALSTIHLDWGALGSEAMRLLSQRQAFPDAAPRQIQLGGRLIPRRST